MMIGKHLDASAKLLLNRSNWTSLRAYIEWGLSHALTLKKFKDIHKGEDCFILGNGPSLNNVDLDLLSEYYTFGLNKIYLLFDRSKFRPSYHVAVNPLVIEQSVSEFERLACPSFLSYRPSRNKFKGSDHLNYILTGGPLTFSESMMGRICEGWTVTYVAMQIAYYMGFKNVFLIGVDHSFVTSGAPNEQQLLQGNDVNHFDPNYFGNNEWHLPDLQGSEIAYHLAKFFYERDDRHIYDATIDGKLQVFPKLSFEESLAACRKKG